MSGQSNVGTSGVYEAGDQRNAPQSLADERERYKEGQPNSHKANDPKDERSIANKLAREESREDNPDKGKSLEDIQREQDATLPARSHGNEPSKGAKIDQQIQEEEEEILKKKGAFGPQ